MFDAAHAGRVDLGWIDQTTARPTGQLLSAVIWLFALVAAYPYIPGSDSEAFKGVGVFVGLMLSIGSSGIVNQAVSGMMLMYTRSLRPGEFVQIGDDRGHRHLDRVHDDAPRDACDARRSAFRTR